MQSNEQKLREALQAYQDANEMSPYGDYSKIEWESSAGPVNPSWGGGDCKKHGRWYGRCYSCSDEWDNLRKRADRAAYTARENALNAAKQIARQVLALPTAVPVGDLVDLPRYTAWSHLKAHGIWPEGIDRSWMKDEMGRYNDVTVSNAVIAELRAALSAGDAVDAQRTPLTVLQYNAIPELCAIPPSLYESVVRAIERAHGIDATMRKGQL